MIQFCSLILGYVLSGPALPQEFFAPLGVEPEVGSESRVARAPGEQEWMAPTGSAWTRPLTENLRWDLDLSLRGHVDRQGDTGFAGAFGLDLNKVFSTSTRDVATVVLQPYLLRRDAVAPGPPIFDDDHDFAVQWRIFNANFNLTSSGAYRMRFGHFEFPFGLEQNVDTNGTLWQYSHGMNFGTKTDWGATLNGDMESFEYELAWSRGSGNEFLDRGGDGVWSGRIGTPRNGASVYGLSFLSGDLTTTGSPVDQRRAAIDASFTRRSMGARFEVSGGRVGGRGESWTGIAEANWVNPYETQRAWLQLFARRVDAQGPRQSSLELRLGARVQVSRGAYLGAQLSQVMDTFAIDASRGASLVVQLRYRF